MNRTIRHTFLAATTACGLWLAPATAQTTATTDPVGAVKFTLQPGADNLIGLPLRNAVKADLQVSSISETASDVWEIGIASESLDPGEFDQGYFVRFKDGPLEGYYFTIVGNTQQSISLEGLGVDLSVVSADDSFSVVSYWSLSELFPPAEQGPEGSLVLSSGDRLSQRGSQILFPDLSGTGINRSSSETFYVKNEAGGGWARNSDRSAANNQALLPEMYIIIRQPVGAGIRELTVTGSVEIDKESVFLYTLPTGGGLQDNYVAMTKPVPTTLDELNFGESFVDSSGDRLSQRKDQLLVFGSPNGLNPSATETFYKVAGEWRRNSDRSPAGNYVLEPGAAFVVRKAETPNGGTAVWTYSIQ